VDSSGELDAAARLHVKAPRDTAKKVGFRKQFAPVTSNPVSINYEQKLEDKLTELEANFRMREAQSEHSEIGGVTRRTNGPRI